MNLKKLVEPNTQQTTNGNGSNTSFYNLNSSDPSLQSQAGDLIELQDSKQDLLVSPVTNDVPNLSQGLINYTPQLQPTEVTPVKPGVSMQQMPNFDLEVQASPQIESTAVIDTIVKQATNPAERLTETIIPELGSDVLTAAEINSLELKLKQSTSFAVLARNVFVSFIILGVIMTSYLFYRLQATRESAFQASLTVEEVVTSSKELQKEYNLKIYEILSFYVSDAMWQSLEFINSSQKELELANKRAELEFTLNRISKLTSKLTVLEGESAVSDRAELIRNLPDSLKNSSVEAVMRSKRLHEELSNSKKMEKVFVLSDQEFMDWLVVIVADFELEQSKLAEIGSQRPLWSEIIGQIEATTKQIDPNFGNEETQFIEYSNYNFNARTGNVTVTGQIRTENEKTFSLIADLIDAIEAQPDFKDVKTRSFTKGEIVEQEQITNSDGESETVSVNQGYSATLKLDFVYSRNSEELKDLTQ